MLAVGRTRLRNRPSSKRVNTRIEIVARRKRQFRSLWIIRINAAAREHGLSYSLFIAGLTKAAIEVDRKVLADLAMHQKAAFGALVEQAKSALAA